jgi:hypothetical protein
MPRLRRSYTAKAIIVTILIILAIAFGATLDSKNNVAGELLALSAPSPVMIWEIDHSSIF